MPTLSRADAAHLLRRAGFGGQPAEIDALTGLERATAVDRVLDTSGNPPATETPGGHAQPEVPNESEYPLWVDMSHYWLDRMATVPAPVQEKLALFWHGHFVSEQKKIYDSRRLWQQNQLFRRYGMGDFEELTQRVAVDPAMLLYLDNAFNDAERPQENFARELMELFTLGVDQYTQDDVVGMARAWTGHGLAHSWPQDGRYYVFDPDDHDYGLKTIFGQTRTWDGPEVIHEICSGSKRDTMARFIAAKLWSFFAYPDPAPGIVDALAGAFVGSRSITALLRAVLLHDEFWSGTARNGLMRSPIEFVVAVMRATGRTASQLRPDWSFTDMGQVLFDPPNVSGWRPNGYWVTTSGLSGRASFARHVMWDVADDPGFPLNDTVVHPNSGLSNAQVVQRGFDTFGITEPTLATRALLENWLAAKRNKWYATGNLLIALMSSPDFNLA